MAACWMFIVEARSRRELERFKLALDLPELLEEQWLRDTQEWRHDSVVHEVRHVRYLSRPSINTKCEPAQ